MQKVEGSSPFIRLTREPRDCGAFVVVEERRCEMLGRQTRYQSAVPLRLEHEVERGCNAATERCAARPGRHFDRSEQTVATTLAGRDGRVFVVLPSSDRDEALRLPFGVSAPPLQKNLTITR